jgi:hypothetical protein
MMRAGVFLFALLPIVQGCSSNYEPARSPHITTVVEGSSPVFVKNGERIGTTSFGGGLVGAMQDNPRAAAQARIGRNLAIGGIVFDIVGLGSETAGLVLVAENNRPGQPDHSNTVPWALAIGGVASVVVGTVLLLASPPHIYDAVNIYNDDLDKPR